MVASASSALVLPLLERTALLVMAGGTFGEHTQRMGLTDSPHRLSSCHGSLQGFLPQLLRSRDGGASVRQALLCVEWHVMLTRRQLLDGVIPRTAPPASGRCSSIPWGAQWSAGGGQMIPIIDRPFCETIPQGGPLGLFSNGAAWECRCTTQQGTVLRSHTGNVHGAAMSRRAAHADREAPGLGSGRTAHRGNVYCWNRHGR
mmetsp:Transcript_43138/g.77540  ORF Transcript_43138/g.77540 Transcript_43138/m.77540 type:complete len:202 (-) Transcript_43138:486-1091(-)